MTRAGGDHAGNFALHETFGGFGIFHLLADGDSVAFGEQTGHVALDGVVRDSGHGHADAEQFFLASGESDFQISRDGFGVVGRKPRRSRRLASEAGTPGRCSLISKYSAHHRSQGIEVVFGHGFGCVRTGEKEAGS